MKSLIKKWLQPLIMLILWLWSANVLSAQPSPTAPCHIVPQKRLFSLNQLTQVCSDDLIRDLAYFQQPAPTGALGPNYPAFQHIAHQAGLLATVQWAVDQQSLEHLKLGVAAIGYSLAQQQPEGHFGLTAPAPRNAADSAYWLQGEAHAAAAFGCALVALRESPWARQQASLQHQRQQWEPLLRRWLDFLLQQKQYLELAGNQSASQLLTAALGCYSLGSYLDHAPARAAGLALTAQVLEHQHPAGYFLEQGGWNTSANAQLLEMGFALLCLLPPTEPLANRWFAALGCSLHWQAGRTSSLGQVNTTGDTPPSADPQGWWTVHPYVQYHRNLKALLLGYFFTDDPRFYSLAHKVKMTQPRPEFSPAGGSAVLRE